MIFACKIFYLIAVLAATVAAIVSIESYNAGAKKEYVSRGEDDSCSKPCIECCRSDFDDCYKKCSDEVKHNTLNF